MSATTTYQPTIRVHTSVLAAAEKRLLIWMASRLPRWVNSDHLTAAAAVAMVGVGGCYWAASVWPSTLAGVIPFLALNWFGDSLDGTLARVRRQERPRYGYYVDHVLDAVGFAALICGLVLGGQMSPVPGLGFLSAYYVLLVEIALAAHARGRFTLAFWRVGPTELRILLAIGTLMLSRSTTVVVFGSRWLLFDVGALVGTAGLVTTFAVTAIQNGKALYDEERLG
jgi:phosphatidylglycerophosphate synthase